MVYKIQSLPQIQFRFAPASKQLYVELVDESEPNGLVHVFYEREDKSKRIVLVCPRSVWEAFKK